MTSIRSRKFFPKGKDRVFSFPLPRHVHPPSIGEVSRLDERNQQLSTLASPTLSPGVLDISLLLSLLSPPCFSTRMYSSTIACPPIFPRGGRGESRAVGSYATFVRSYVRMLDAKPGSHSSQRKAATHRLTQLFAPVISM